MERKPEGIKMAQDETKLETMNKAEPEQHEDAAPDLLRSSEYVERPKSTRILAWILLVIVITGVILYYLWSAGILHE